MRLLTIGAFLLASISGAVAQGLTDITILDGAGDPQTYRVVQDASNKYSSTSSICDPTSGAAAVGNCLAIASGRASVNVTALGGTAVDTSSGNKSAGTLRTTIATDAVAVPLWGHAAVGSAIPAGASLMGVTDSGTTRAVPGDATNGVFVNIKACATGICGPSGGATSTFAIAANSNNSTNLKASAGTVYGVQLSGISSAPAYLKLYNKATAPTCGTDTPIAVFMIPANSTAANGGGSNVSLPVGKTFTTGIGYCIVTGIANNDNTSVAAATFAINIDWN
jgi:hypothetical protein